LRTATIRGSLMRLVLKRASAAFFVIKLLTASVQAAGLYPSPDDDLNPISWTGFIVAPYFGYETLNLNGAGSAGLGDPKGWRVGGEVDYDYQIGNFVVGIAGDAFYTWYDSNATDPRSGLSTRLSDYETVRARLGYAVGRWMFFGTGGVAFGDLEIKNALSGVSQSQMLTGWTAGAGAEWVWSNNITLRGEVAHMDFGSARFDNLPTPNQDVGATLDLFKVDFITRF
jgi:outer membrane immunogenic protein